MTPMLVTGAAGFIGARIATCLLERGTPVVGVDNLNDAYDVRMKHWRLARLQHHPAFHFHCLDIGDRAGMERLFRSARRPTGPPFEAVIHLAARAGVHQSVLNPWAYYETNTVGTLTLVELCRKYAVGKFVLSSTSSLYGKDNPLPHREDQNTDHPLSPYAASKKAAEEVCYVYHHLYGLDVTVLRYFTVYGPAGRPDMSLFRFVQWNSEARPVRLFGDGSQSRDFTYVDDIARGTIAGLARLGYEVINLGSDQPVGLLDAIHLLEELLQAEARLEFQPMHPADVQATWADTRKATQLLGWRPEQTFRQGLGELVRWYQENRSWAREIRV
jgi:nucleoside-diphosphate-sugar epimerase